MQIYYYNLHFIYNLIIRNNLKLKLYLYIKPYE